MPVVTEFIRLASVGALAWLVLLDVAYIVLIWRSVETVVRGRRMAHVVGLDELGVSRFAPSLTLVVPAHDEAAVIVENVGTLLGVNWRRLQVVVVCDGCNDDTVERLVQSFHLQPSGAYRRSLPECAPIRATWASPADPRLLVVDTLGGGKADALNCGIGFATGELVCVVDADSRLDVDALARCVRPFVESPGQIAACGGIVRVANGSWIGLDGRVEQQLPRRMLERFQVVEYLRAFLVGHAGWSGMGALPLISGAFGVFRRDVLEHAGGFDVETVSEDLELVLRLHRTLPGTGLPTRVVFVPDPVVWTEVPDTARVLRQQRTRWHRGLAESLWAHRAMMFSRQCGRVGTLAMPFLVLFELLAPVVELFGLVVTLAGLALGVVSGMTVIAFVLLSVTIGMLISVAALLLDEIALAAHPRSSALVMLVATAFIENFGYRQVTALWRLRALGDLALGRRAQWGRMEHHGAFDAGPSSAAA